MNTHMGNWAEAWASWATAASWQIAILIALVALAAFLSRRLSARFRYLLWMLVIIKALTPPTIGAVWSIGNWVGPHRWSDVSVRIETTPAKPAQTISTASQTTQGVEPVARIQTVKQQSNGSDKTYATYRTYHETAATKEIADQPWSASAILLAVWLAGFAGLSAFILFRYLRLTRVLSRGEQVDEGPLRITIEKLALRIGKANPPVLILSDAVSSPFLFGLLQPRIVLPAALPSSLTPDQMEDVLLHELIHWRRRDVAAGWLQILVQALFWFHPLVWFAGSQLRHERECACDEAALESGCSQPRRYGESLLKVLLEARGRSAVALGFLGIFERNTRLQKRLEEIMNQESKVRRLTVWSWAALALFAIASLPMAEVQSSTSDPSLTPLHRAAMTGQPEMVKLLIGKGADVKAMNKEGRTALHLSVRGGHQQTSEELLAGGADINAKDEQGQTPLILAAENGHNGLTAWLVSKGADVKSRDRSERTALHWAALNGNTATAEALLAGGADMNAKDNDGKTPLDLANEQNQAQIAQMLGERGAGLAPLLVAAKNGQLDVVKDLIKKGTADVKARDRQGQTALHLAVYGGHQDIAEALLKAGAEINAKDNIGRTPLAIAVERGHSQLAGVLISRGADVNARAEASKWTQPTSTNTLFSSRPNAIFKGPFKLNFEFANQNIETNGYGQNTLWLRSIWFLSLENTVQAKASFVYTISPKKTWRIFADLLDSNGKPIAQASAQLENPGTRETDESETRIVNLNFGGINPKEAVKFRIEVIEQDQRIGSRINLGQDHFVDAPTTEAAVLYNKANDFFRAKRYAQAIKVNEEIFFKYPQWVESEAALREIGLCYRALGMPDKAVEAWLRAVAEWPALKGFSETTYADLIDELVNQKQYEAAEKIRQQLMNFANNGQLDSHRIGDRFRQKIPWDSSPSEQPGPVDHVSLNQEVIRYVRDIEDATGFKDFAIDLDTGRAITPAEDEKKGVETWDEASMAEFMRKHGADALGKPSIKGLVGVEMAVAPISADQYEAPTAAVVRLVLGAAKPTTPAMMSGQSGLPAAFAFKTREGGLGMLQIVSAEKKFVKIRYRLLESGK